MFRGLTVDDPGDQGVFILRRGPRQHSQFRPYLVEFRLIKLWMNKSINQSITQSINQLNIEQWNILQWSIMKTVLMFIRIIWSTDLSLFIANSLIELFSFHDGAAVLEVFRCDDAAFCGDGFGGVDIVAGQHANRDTGTPTLSDGWRYFRSHWVLCRPS